MVWRVTSPRPVRVGVDAGAGAATEARASRIPATRDQAIWAESETAPVVVDELARARAAARARKDFEASDRLRDEIEAAGWEVRDVDAEPGFQLVPKR